MTSEPEQTEPRKLRVALMGEFSAGKSTLLNMLLSQSSLPVRITATSVPPVWISYGDPAAASVSHDDIQNDLPVGEIGETSLEDTKYIRLWLKADILELCDLFDMPGISDPNMDRSTWLDLYDEVDSVIWCTHATQAWRQSEAATWEEISDRTNGHNILAITQFDKIGSERDRMRLLARVTKETEGQFEAIFPLSLVEATTAEDHDAWIQSGASAFCDHLVDTLLTHQEKFGQDPNQMDEMTSIDAADAADASRISPKRVARKNEGDAPRQRLPADKSAEAYAGWKNADL